MMWPQLAIGFSATDAIDIIATSILTYYLLLLIRGTRAVQIMLGLFALVVILAISNLLHLLVLASLMQYLLLGTAVSLPIIFQPELRRGLEQLGRGRLFVRERGPDEESAAEQVRIVAQAGFVLARQRSGGLIVLEQQTGLRDYVESGTAVDARLSLELLTAIFAKTSPLHDGAVIVRDLTIEGAACFLPLSENTIAVGRHVGTRHRAAVGLSEQTDAVVVVVSACIRPTRRTPKANKSLFANLLTRVPRAQSPSEQFRA